MGIAMQSERESMSSPATESGIEARHPEIPLGRAYYGLAILMLAFMIAMVDRVILALLVEPIQRDLGLSDTQFGLLNGLAFAFFYLFMSVPIARLADRTSRRRIIAIGISLWSLMTMLCGMAQTTAQLFLARIGVGVGESSLSPAAYSMMADMFPSEHIGRAYGIYSAGALIGFGASFLIGGSIIAFVEQSDAIILPVVGALRSWQAVFMLVAIPGFVISALMLTVKEPGRRGPIATSSERHDVRQKAELRRFVMRHLKFLLVYFLAFGCLGMLLFGILTWLPALLGRTYGIDQATAGIALGIGIGIASPAGAVIGGIVSDRLAVRGYVNAPMLVGFWASIAAAILVICIPFAPTSLICVIIVSGLFFCLTMPSPLGPAGLQAIAPSGIRAQVLALYVIATGLAGMATGTVAIGALTDYFFQDANAVGYSIALFGAFAAPAMAFFFYILRKPFSELIAEAQYD